MADRELIIRGSSYGDPREQLRQHEDFVRRADSFRPTLVSKQLQKTASGAYFRRTADSTITSSPLFYDPRWSSPDKFYFPKDERQANNIWRHMYNRDPIIAVGTDLYSELPYSDYDLLGVEDKSIQDVYQASMESCQMLKWVSLITHDFLKLGKAIPHLIWDDSKGFWTRLFLHDPDYIRITPVPILDEEPILDLIPTPELKNLLQLSQQDPRMRAALRRLPNHLITRLMGGLPVPLDNLNVTYLARKSSPYETQGTSLYSRCFRVGMLEDVLYSATISVAQRNAAPLRIFKLGDPETHWLPDESHFEKLAELLATAESDPFAAILFHYGLSVETVGVSDRLFSVTREFDFIERVKLLAMGIAKSFLIGETSYAAATAGLQTMTQRLYSLRQRIEEGWLYPKFLIPIAQMNGFYKRTQAELSHRIRLKRDDPSLLMIPKVKWHKSLEPTRDTDLLRLWKEFADAGFVSKRTLATGAGLDLDTERQNIDSERKYEQKNPQESMERESSGPRNPYESKSADQKLQAVLPHLTAELWDQDQSYFGLIQVSDVEPLVEMLKTGQSLDPDWEEIVNGERRVQFKGGMHLERDPRDLFDRIDGELQRRGYTDTQIKAVFNVLAHEGYDLGVTLPEPVQRKMPGNGSGAKLQDFAPAARDLAKFDRVSRIPSGRVVAGF